MDLYRLRIRLRSAAWMLAATVVCGGLCYLGLFKGTEVLYTRGRVPAVLVFGGVIFGLAALICLLWTLKILFFGSIAEREAPTIPLEQPWWRNPE